MRLLLVVIAVSLVGCGPAVQGPPGPAGPAGAPGSPGSSGRLVLTVPANSTTRFLMANRAGMDTYVFKLGEQVVIPSSATALYVELGVCVPVAAAAGARVVFSTPETENPAEMRATRPCASNSIETRDVWFASTSRDLTALVKNEFGTPPGVDVQIVVRGWFEP